MGRALFIANPKLNLSIIIGTLKNHGAKRIIQSYLLLTLASPDQIVQAASYPPESRHNPVLLDCSWEGWYDGVSAVEYLAVDPPPTHVLPVRPAWLSTLSVCPPQFLNFISFFMTKFTTVASPHLRRGSRARVSALFYSVQLVLL